MIPIVATQNTFGYLFVQGVEEDRLPHDSPGMIHPSTYRKHLNRNRSHHV